VALRGTIEVRNTNPRREVLDNDGRTLTVVHPPPAGSRIVSPARPVSATSHLRSRAQADVASVTSPNSPPTMLPSSVNRAVPHVESPNAVSLRPGRVAWRTEPVRLVKPPTQGVPIVAGGVESKEDRDRTGSFAPNTSAAAANSSTPSRVNPSSPGRLRRENERTLRPQTSSDGLERPIVATLPAAPNSPAVPIPRTPEPTPRAVPAPAPVPAPRPVYVPPSQPIAPASRAESYRAPSVPPAPSHPAPAPAPARSESVSRSSRSGNDGGGSRGNR
jgi:hypothetical protein